MGSSAPALRRRDQNMETDRTDLPLVEPGGSGIQNRSTSRTQSSGSESGSGLVFPSLVWFWFWSNLV